MSKATFPETTGIESLKPLDGGSFSASDLRNALSALFQGDMGALRPRAQTVPDMTIHVNPITLNSFFQQVWGTGNSPLSFGGGNTSVFTAPSANPRIDIVYLNSSGAVAVVAGAEAVSPSANWANLPKDGIPICLVYHRTSETKIVNFEEKDANPNDGYIYMDVRPFLNLGGGASLADMQSAQDNIALLAFRLAVQGSLTVQKMEDGIVDEYEDESGIDTAASQNENYDSVGDNYSPTDAQDLCAGGSPVSGGDENLTGDIIPDSNDKLALNMNGSGASFVDSSPSPKTITTYGNATQLAKKFNRTAGFFNGVSDYVVVPDHADWDFGTGDFTFEFFINFASFTPSNPIIFASQAYNSGVYMAWDGTGGGQLDVYISSSHYTFPAPRVLNTWYHIALVRSGSNLKAYVNGSQVGTTQSNTTNITGLTAGVGIGNSPSPTAGQYLHGWIKEFRISNSARYTAGFTPTTTQFSSDSNTKLLLHFDSGTSAPLGPALYFDGSGDYLSVADHPDWDFGTGDFTIECFAMFEANQFSGLIDVGDGNGGAGVTMFYHSGDSNFENRINGTSFARGYTWTPTPYKWYHLAFVRSAGYATMYVDGRPLGAAQASAHNVAVSAACVIGRWNANTSYMHKGFIREVRISNSARYTSSFTPSPTGFSVDSNTKLYIKGDENNGSPKNSVSVMTSNTAPSGIVSEYAGSSDVWKVFNGIETAEQWFSGLGGAVPATWWLKYQFVSPTIIKSYGMKSCSDYRYTPTGWKLQGSNDGSSWTTLDTQSGISWGNYERKIWSISNAAAYLYYRIAETSGQYLDGVFLTQFYLSEGSNSVLDYQSTPKQVQIFGDTKIKHTEDHRSCIFKDEGNTVHKPYPQGSAKVDFFSAFGDGVYWGGANGDYVSAPNNSDFDFGTGPFCLEAYVRFAEVSTDDTRGIMGKMIGNNEQCWGWLIAPGASNYMVFYGGVNSASLSVTPPIWRANTWYHIAITKETYVKFFINGIQVGTNQTPAASYNGASTTLKVGLAYGSNCFRGLIDNVRISKGVARHIDTFNPIPNVGTNPKEGAFDDSTSTWWGSVQTGANVSGAAYVGYNFASPVTPKAFTIKQHANYIGSVKVQRSSDGSSWVDVETVTISENNTKNAYSFSNSTAAQYWRLLANDNPSSGSWQVEEIEFMVGAKNDITLISNGFTAEATPAEIRIVLFEEDVDSSEINTDLKAWVSRDDGTTWSQITLVDEGDYDASKRILSGSISVSGQPSGVAVKYKVTTHNNRNMKFHGVSLGWKA